MEIIVKPLIWTYRKIQKNEPNSLAGEHEVRIRLTQGKDIKYISVGFSSSKENWDDANGLPFPSHPNYKPLLKCLNRYLSDIDFEIKLIERSGRIPTPIEIKIKVTKQDKAISHSSSPTQILAYFDKVINDLEDAGNPGYADVFVSTRSTVSKLLNNGKHIPVSERTKEKDKLFLAFTKEDHQLYEKMISKDSSESTISVYLRTFYRVWNLAIKDGLCTKDHHPSKYIRFKAYKKIRTQKRSIKSDYLQKIFQLSYPYESRKYRSQKLLQFLYYARGINFNDMCKLKKEQFVNDGIDYKRSKNKRSYNFELHPKALDVVHIFENYPIQSDANYLFPFLNLSHNSPRKVDRRIDSALKDLNEDIKEMAESVGWHKRFSSYSVRHGFASHLRDKGVDISIIQEALGHETEAQTRVYLDEIDDAPISIAINNALD
ncbi:MAG TPA: tyrosine-type recombinase/integrase [Mucilaginibacter sp.]|nr:tyrosine-type recombinase/integrase [Mucilaginibacter sp.]